ncbi:MAG: helix-turn-helix domain-containing protein [Pseudonocardiaceae bacterium]
MCVHHRTVAYRLQRVGELTGLRLNDQELPRSTRLQDPFLGCGRVQPPQHRGCPRWRGPYVQVRGCLERMTNPVTAIQGDEANRMAPSLR